MLNNKKVLKFYVCNIVAWAMYNIKLHISFCLLCDLTSHKYHYNKNVTIIIECKYCSSILLWWYLCDVGCHNNHYETLGVCSACYCILYAFKSCISSIPWNSKDKFVQIFFVTSFWMQISLILHIACVVFVL